MSCEVLESSKPPANRRNAARHSVKKVMFEWHNAYRQVDVSTNSSTTSLPRAAHVHAAHTTESLHVMVQLITLSDACFSQDVQPVFHRVSP
jgi:hypothetical protein